VDAEMDVVVPVYHRVFGVVGDAPEYVGKQHPPRHRRQKKQRGQKKQRKETKGTDLFITKQRGQIYLLRRFC
jgi:hypothetical protein